MKHELITFYSMENFISGIFYVPSSSDSLINDEFVGYPGSEFQIREALAQVVGTEKRDLFFDKVQGFPFLALIRLKS